MEDITNHGRRYWNEPWLIGGYFNTPLNLEDKLGGRVNLSRRIELFRKFININNLIDLPLKGNAFTWLNKQCGRKFIQRKLDRFMAIKKWIEEYQNFDPISLPRIALDHRPLLLYLEPLKKKKSPFRFEYMWEHHDSFKSSLKEWWSIEVKGIAMFRLFQKLKNVKKEIKKWNRDVFKNVQK